MEITSARDDIFIRQANQTWYHGVGQNGLDWIHNNQLSAPSGVMMPAKWFMLTDSFEQAKVYAGQGGTVLEYSIPDDLTNYRNEGALLWPSQPHSAYDFPDAHAVALKQPIPNSYIVGEYPA
jgi:hypothetical protein